MKKELYILIGVYEDEDKLDFALSLQENKTIVKDVEKEDE